VEVRNSAGAVTSSGSTLTVYLTPSITSLPVPTINCVSDSATLTVTAAGDSRDPNPVLAYQWQYNGVDIPDAHADTLIIDAPITRANAGIYTVIVINTYGSTTSAPVTINLTDTLPPVFDVDPLPNIGPVECGSPVTFAPTATDPVCGGVVAVVCVPPSGTAFPVGPTTVNCTATDGANNTTTGSFTVTVADTIAPVISGCPGDQTATAVDGKATVTWTLPTALDACVGAVPVVCTPASGSEFNTGTTPVDCVAADVIGNAAHCTFNVVVTACGTRPTLNYTYNGTTLTLTWASTTCYSLFVRGDLAPPPVGNAKDLEWSAYTGTITDNGTTCTVIITLPTTGNQFFMLK
jgi:hypothetical protein